MTTAEKKVVRQRLRAVTVLPSGGSADPEFSFFLPCQ